MRRSAPRISRREPAAPLGLPAGVLEEPHAVGELRAQPLHVARVRPRLARQVLERLGAAPRGLQPRHPRLRVVRALGREVEGADDRRRA
jgi:hypothetical protein